MIDRYKLVKLISEIDWIEEHIEVTADKILALEEKPDWEDIVYKVRFAQYDGDAEWTIPVEFGDKKIKICIYEIKSASEESQPQGARTYLASNTSDREIKE